MRTIAVIYDCTENEKNYILSSVADDDRVLFFNNEQELLKSEELTKIDILMGEPDISTIKAMSSLRWLQMTWAGVNIYVPFKELFENIVLTNASGAYGTAISEYIISGILTIYRNVFPYRAQIQAGGWERIMEEDTLEGKRVLILGTGNIGEETAKRLKGFDASPIGMSRRKKANPEYFEESYTIEDLDNQLAIADIVVIALPGTKETTGMFDETRINKMKKGAMLVNVGRGYIVDTDALTNALKTGQLSSAVLDVVEPEPLPENHELRHMENVFLTPHCSGIGWGGNMKTRKRILDIFTTNLKLDLSGNKLEHAIDLNIGY